MPYDFLNDIHLQILVIIEPSFQLWPFASRFKISNPSRCVKYSIKSPIPICGDLLLTFKWWTPWYWGSMKLNSIWVQIGAGTDSLRCKNEFLKNGEEWFIWRQLENILFKAVLSTPFAELRLSVNFLIKKYNLVHFRLWHLPRLCRFSQFSGRNVPVILL